MRRLLRFLPALSLAGLLGCPCPTTTGADGLITLESCEVPSGFQAEVQLGSEWGMNSPEEAQPITSWESDAPATLEVTPIGPAARVHALEEGDATLSVTLADGTTDTFDWTVARAARFELWPALGNELLELVAQSYPISGSWPVEPLGEEVLLFSGGRLPARPLVESDSGARMQWSASAFSVSGSIRSIDTGFELTPGSGQIDDVLGEELSRHTITEVSTVAGGSIELAVFHSPVPEAIDERTSSAVMATVRNAAGQQVFQVPLDWRVPGADELTGTQEMSGMETDERTDVVLWNPGEDFSDGVCISARTAAGPQQLRASAWLAADGSVEFFEDATCAARGCGCSTSGPPSRQRGAALIGVTLLLGLWRRRQPRPS